MEKYTGGPAFPCHTNPRPGQLADAPQGMTLCDYFAAKAMQVMAQDGWAESERGGLAAEAYAMADAMLEARKVRT